MAEELQAQADSTGTTPQPDTAGHGLPQPAGPAPATTSPSRAKDSGQLAPPAEPSPTRPDSAATPATHPQPHVDNSPIRTPPAKDDAAPPTPPTIPFGVPTRNLSQLLLAEEPSALTLPEGVARLAQLKPEAPAELWAGSLQRPPIQPPSSQRPSAPMANTPPYLGPATLLLLAGIAVVLRLRYWSHYTLHLTLLRDPRSIRRMELEATVKLDVFNSLGDILFTLTSGYLLWRSVLFFGLAGDATSLQVYLLSMAFTAGYVLLRFLGLHLGPLLLGDTDAASTLWRQEEYCARLAWLPLLLLNVCATYTGTWGTRIALLCGLALMAASGLYTWVRVALTFVGKGYRPFYFFLYFCGLEIMPALLMLKAVRIL